MNAVAHPVLPTLLALLDEVLALGGRAHGFTPDTALLGALPELDSMAVVDLLSGLQSRFGFTLHDDDVDGNTFATVGSLLAFVQSKLG